MNVTGVYDCSSEVCVYRNGLSEVKCTWHINERYDRAQDLLMRNIVPNFVPETILFDPPSAADPEFSIGFYNTLNSPHSDDDVLKHYHRRHVLVIEKDNVSARAQPFTGELTAYNRDTITVSNSSGGRVYRRRDMHVSYELELCLEDGEKLELRPSFFIHMSTTKKNVVLNCSYVSTDYRYTYNHFMTVSRDGVSMQWDSNATLHSDSGLPLAPMKIHIVDGELAMRGDAKAASECSTHSREVLDIRAPDFSYPLNMRLQSARTHPCEFFYLYDARDGTVTKTLRIPIQNHVQARELFFPGTVTVRRCVGTTRETVGHTTLDVNTNVCNYTDLQLGKESAVVVQRTVVTVGKNTNENSETVNYVYKVKNSRSEECELRIRDIFHSAYSDVVSQDSDIDIKREGTSTTTARPENRVRVFDVTLPPNSHTYYSLMEKYLLDH